MGILDDAIRQHLDLKRRLGAADDELARLEDEAFGPPTRPGDPDFPDTGSEQVVEQADEPRADPSEPAVENPIKSAAEAPGEPSARVEEEVARPAEPSAPADEVVVEQPQTGEEPDLSVPLPPTTAEEPFEPPIESLDTVEHPFEEAVEDTGEAEVVEGELEEPGSPSSEGADDDEDVLEETPEFLRDQPEDDELWFEQGEPKDFDF